MIKESKLIKRKERRNFCCNKLDFLIIFPATTGKMRGIFAEMYLSKKKRKVGWKQKEQIIHFEAANVVNVINQLKDNKDPFRYIINSLKLTAKRGSQKMTENVNFLQLEFLRIKLHSLLKCLSNREKRFKVTINGIGFFVFRLSG